MARRPAFWYWPSRTMTLPEGVDPKNIKAKTHDGLLEVRIPLPEETPPEAFRKALSTALHRVRRESRDGGRKMVG